MNIKKYAGLTMFVGTTLVLSSCDIVGKSDYHVSNYNHIYLSSHSDLDSSDNKVIITTTVTSPDPVVTTTTEPYAYAGYGYKEFEKSNKDVEPYAYAGYGYKEFEKSNEDVEPYAYAGYGYKEFEKSNEDVEPYAYAGYGYKEFEKSNEDVEPYAYAGYGYKEYEKSMNVDTQSYTSDGYNQNVSDFGRYTDILYSNEATSMDGKYVYLRCDDFYKMVTEDTIDGLCSKFNISTEQLCAHNPTVNDYSEGTVIAYPVMSEFYVGKKGESINSIAVETGVDVDYIINNNKLDLTGNILNNDEHIFLHKFIGNDSSYKTNKGVVNIINNNRILGNKVIKIGNFSDCVVALNESVYSYGVNDVTCYSFDGNKYISDIICFNAKDIIVVDGKPIAVLRNYDDIVKLAKSAGVDIDDTAYLQWGSTVCTDYFVDTSANNDYVIIEGVKNKSLGLNKSLVKSK